MSVYDLHLWMNLKSVIHYTCKLLVTSLSISLSTALHSSSSKWYISKKMAKTIEFFTSCRSDRKLGTEESCMFLLSHFMHYKKTGEVATSDTGYLNLLSIS